jgi:hypothetical protein
MPRINQGTLYAALVRLESRSSVCSPFQVYVAQGFSPARGQT